MDLPEAIRKAKDETIMPGELSKIRLWLAGEYAYLNNDLIGVLMEKPDMWDKIRYQESVKSDTAAERLWERTEMGRKETLIRHKLKSIDKLSSAIKTRIDVLEGESRNNY